MAMVGLSGRLSHIMNQSRPTTTPMAASHIMIEEKLDTFFLFGGRRPIMRMRRRTQHN